MLSNMFLPIIFPVFLLGFKVQVYFKVGFVESITSYEYAPLVFNVCIGIYKIATLTFNFAVKVACHVK